MYRIAVMGDERSVLGFAALGLEVYPVSGAEEARTVLHRLAREEVAIIYMTEQLAAGLSAEKLDAALAVVRELNPRAAVVTTPWD